ncbi:class I SAM-dependent methyltransferase [Flavitalea flava]
MNRLSVLKALMQQKNLRNYLEIGVFNGHIFFRIRSNFKIAVDPDFAFSNSRKAVKVLLNPFNLFNRYFQKPSDDFFEQDAPSVFAEKKIELSLIDGMHEYEYALRDVENTLKYATEDVVIIMHDCNPKVKEDACSFKEWKARNFTGTWNGDVWKVILHLRSLRNDLTSFVLDCDQGLGVIVKRKNGHPKNENPLSYTRDQISQLTFEDFTANREKFLDLRPESYFMEFFGLNG